MTYDEKLFTTKLKTKKASQYLLCFPVEFEFLFSIFFIKKNEKEIFIQAKKKIQLIYIRKVVKVLLKQKK